MAVEENEGNREVLFFGGGGLNWRSLKGSKANGKREGLDIYSKEIE